MEQFNPERREDPALRALLNRIVSSGSEELDAIKRETFGSRPAEVLVRLRDGRSFCERLVFPPGTPQNPLRAGGTEGKVLLLVGPSGEGATGEGPLAAGDGPENVEDVARVGLALLVKA